MMKGLRWPLLALVLGGALLVLALVTQPDDSPGAALTPAAVLPAPSSTPADALAAAPSPQVLPTPLPVIPLENILVEALIGQINKLNPLLATVNPVDSDITALIFEGLTTTNQYGEIVPDLAASWRVSADGLQYIFTLREDVLWHDGLPFTAEDVVFTVGLMSDPQFPGAAALHDFWKTIEAEALGEHMVRFRLTQPLASFADQLRIGIVPAHVLRGYPVSDLWRHPFNLAPIGTGPYQIETLTASGGKIDGIQLRVAPVYRQRPEGAAGYLLDRVIFRTYPSAAEALDAYRRGEVNSIGSLPPDLQNAAAQVPGLAVYPAVAPRVGVLIYNWRRDSTRFVRNPRVRLALAQAVDRHELVMAHLSGRAIPADSPLLPGSWAFQDGLDWLSYDPAAAQAMLDSADVTFAEPISPVPTESATETPPEGEAPPTEATAEATPEAIPDPPRALTILVLDDPALVALANGIAAGWGQLGFSAPVEAVDAATLRARLVSGDFDAALVELSFEPSADPDPFVFWHQGQYGIGQNYGGMDDRRISEALELARRDATGINRVEHYRRFQTLFAERAPALVLYYPLMFYAADARLQGVQLGFLSSPADRFRTIQDWAFVSP